MILVTLGTQDKPFVRLLEMVQQLINEKIIDQKVNVQAGYTVFNSKDMNIFDYIDMDSFKKMLDECDILITHGGVGMIVTAVKDGKKVIGVAREARYGEHHNDHQKEIIETFTEEGYILSASNVDELKEALLKINDFIPNKYQSNTDNFIDLIRKEIGKQKS